MEILLLTIIYVAIMMYSYYFIYLGYERKISNLRDRINEMRYINDNKVDINTDEFNYLKLKYLIELNIEDNIEGYDQDKLQERYWEINPPSPIPIEIDTLPIPFKLNKKHTRNRYEYDGIL